MNSGEGGTRGWNNLLPTWRFLALSGNEGYGFSGMYFPKDETAASNNDTIMSSLILSMLVLFAPPSFLAHHEVVLVRGWY